MASFRIIVQPSADQELREIPFPFRRQIIQAIHKLKIDPIPRDCEPMDSGIYRLAVHGWSVVYGVDEDAGTVTIYLIGRRD